MKVWVGVGAVGKGEAEGEGVVGRGGGHMCCHPYRPAACLCRPGGAGRGAQAALPCQGMLLPAGCSQHCKRVLPTAAAARGPRLQGMAHSEVHELRKEHAREVHDLRARQAQLEEQMAQASEQNALLEQEKERFKGKAVRACMRACVRNFRAKPRTHMCVSMCMCTSV